MDVNDSPTTLPPTYQEIYIIRQMIMTVYYRSLNPLMLTVAKCSLSTFMKSLKGKQNWENI